MEYVDRLYEAILEYAEPTTGPVSAYLQAEALSNSDRAGSLYGSICAKVLGRKPKHGAGTKYTLYLDDGLRYPKDSIVRGTNKIWDTGALILYNAAVELFSDINRRAQLWRDMGAQTQPNKEWSPKQEWPPICDGYGCGRGATDQTITLSETSVDIQYWCDKHLYKHLEVCQRPPFGTWHSVLEIKSISDCTPETTVINLIRAVIRYDNGEPVVVETEST